MIGKLCMKSTFIGERIKKVQNKTHERKLFHCLSYSFSFLGQSQGLEESGKVVHALVQPQQVEERVLRHKCTLSPTFMTKTKKFSHRQWRGRPTLWQLFGLCCHLAVFLVELKSKKRKNY